MEHPGADTPDCRARVTAGERPAPTRQVQRRTRPESPQDAAGTPRLSTGSLTRSPPEQPRRGAPGMESTGRWPGQGSAGLETSRRGYTGSSSTGSGQSDDFQSCSCPGLGRGHGGVDAPPRDTRLGSLDPQDTYGGRPSPGLTHHPVLVLRAS